MHFQDKMAHLFFLQNEALRTKVLKIILAKKTNELILFFHKKTTKLAFLWPNMSQKNQQSVKNNQCVNIT